MAAIQDAANKAQTTAQGLTAMEKLLFQSVFDGKVELVKKILDKGASVNTADKVREQSRSKLIYFFSSLLCSGFPSAFSHFEGNRGSDHLL